MKRGSRQKREDENLKYIGSGEDPPNAFIVKFINDTVGHGVFAKKDFEKGSFLMEYAGERISVGSALLRETEYEKKNMGCYIYFNIKSPQGRFCIDATNSKQCARFVNDSPSRYSNAVIKSTKKDGKVFLALFALVDIKENTEIRYDYGEDPKKMSWRLDKKNFHPLVLAKKAQNKDIHFNIERNFARHNDDKNVQESIQIKTKQVLENTAVNLLQTSPENQ